MKVAIVGATGYGGVELIRLLYHHPHIDEISVFSSSQEGKSMIDNYSHFIEIVDLTLEKIDAERLKTFDAVFFSTPPGVSSEWTEKIAGETKVIDLSGDLRLKDGDVYEKWYGRESASEALLTQAVYGLSEWHEEEIKHTSILSNPGCYPTAALLGLAPLVQANAIDTNHIIIDAKSGTTGAGRSLSPITHFSEMNDNFKIYKVNEHKHTPEIEQQLMAWGEKELTITFTPHLVPMTRGIMATMYAPVQDGWTKEQIKALYEKAYAYKPFVRLRGEGAFPFTKEVYGTNYCDIGWSIDDRTNRITIVSVIDNLVKGASGQAIQNMNFMFGFEETAGLNMVPVYP